MTCFGPPKINMINNFAITIINHPTIGESIANC